VLAQAPVFTMALLQPVWVRTYVSEAYLGKVRPGMKARVFTDSSPDKPYEAWIGYVSPVAEFTPKNVETPELRTSLVYRMRVYVKNPGRTLRQGMPVTVRIKLEAPKSKPAKTSSR
jgi:HlyD family secretion protein